MSAAAHSQQETKKIRIVMVEDHHLVRAGLLVLISNLENVEIVGDASTGPQGLSLVESQKPDIAIFDINLPDKNGLECCEEIVPRFPATKVLMLSMHATASFVHQAVKVGASGYLLKDAAQSELEIAIQALARNESYFSPKVSTHLLSAMREKTAKESAPQNPDGNNPFDKLTPRQREVVKLVVDGCNTKQIATRLGLSAKTVEAHRQQIQQRIEIHDVASLTRLALRWNIITHRPTLDFSESS